MKSLALFAALAVSVLLAACSSNDFYRARVEGDGHLAAQAFRVKDGAESAITNRYTLDGKGSVSGQTVKPYLTLDGSWRADQTPAASRVTEDSDAVLIRGSGDCKDGSCAAPPRASASEFPEPYCPVPKTPADFRRLAPPPVPGVAKPAAPCPPVASAPAPAAASDSTCGRLVYVGCSGVEGGNRPTPRGDLCPVIEPGTGWPCKSAGAVGDKVLGAAMLPPGAVVHVGICTVSFVRCLFGL